MANQWLRLWHDMPNDPKWRTISKVSGEPISLVIATYIHLLVSASSNGKSRGVTQCHIEDVTSALDCDMSQIERIIDAMQGRVLDGNSLKGWELRQPKREDCGDEETGAKSAAQRKKEQREREKLSKELAQITEGTQSHAASRNVTLDKDKDKDKEILKPPKSPKGDDVRFETFWSAYPKKVGKDAGRKAFEKRNVDDELLKVMLDAIAVQSKSSSWTKDGGQFIPNPATWLNDGRWQDGAPPPKPPSDWWSVGGFSCEAEARNFCGPSTVHQFRDGKKLESA